VEGLATVIVCTAWLKAMEKRADESRRFLEVIMAAL